MFWSEIFPVFLSTAVIAAALAAIANIIVTLLNNSRLKSIEKDKHINELVYYRYTKLYNYHEEIQSIEKPSAKDLIDDNESGALRENEYYQLVARKYILIKPLLEKEVREPVEKLHAKIIADKVNIIKNKDNLKVEDYSDLLPNIIMFEQVLTDCITEQLERLIHN